MARWGRNGIAPVRPLAVFIMFMLPAAFLAYLQADTATSTGAVAGKPAVLDCVAPDVQRVAGGAIDFQARIEYSSDISSIDLCGAFSGKKICGLMSTGEVTMNEGAGTSRPGDTTTYIVNFHLKGFSQPAEHEYMLWLEPKRNRDTESHHQPRQQMELASCSASFQTVHFPGWDNYVQSYYNASETLRALDEDYTEPMSRVGRPGHAEASFERLPDLLGPQLDAGLGTTQTKEKALLVTFAGKNSIEHIDALATKFTQHGSRFTFVLFAYDRTNWARFDWIERATVIRVTGTMKWRFVRTFLQPSLVASYSHVVIMDEDCNIDGLDMGAFLDDMRRSGVQIGQPANGYGSYGSHEVVRMQEGRGVVWTNFVECGPLLSIDSEVWPCVFNDILFPDITCGYGLDLVWSHCGRTAVLHQHAMVHENRKPASNRPNFVMRCAAEGLALFQRLAHKGITPVDPAEINPPESLPETAQR